MTTRFVSSALTVDETFEGREAAAPPPMGDGITTRDGAAAATGIGAGAGWAGSETRRTIGGAT